MDFNSNNGNDNRNGQRDDYSFDKYNLYDNSEEQKRSFKKGIVTGVTVSLIVALVLVIAAFFGKDLIQGNKGGTDITGMPTSGLTEGAQMPTQAGVTPVPTKPVKPVGGNIFSSITNEELLSKIREINDIIDQGSLYGASDEAKVEAVISGILNALNDKYAAYYTVENMQKFQESTSGTYSGIGALVSQNPDTKVITIVRPFAGGPAYNAGLLKDDVIVNVAGIDVTNMDINEVVTYMKGPAGTNVTIQIRRDGELKTYTLTRATIEVPTVEHEMLADKIGYIQVTEFDGVTVEQFYSAVADLEKQGMEGLVIDLRDNPGGLVSTAVSLVDRIVPTGVVVYTEDKNGNKDYNYGTTATELKIPICLIVNGNSASASEIFAGALRDYGKCTIVGTTTYGKGIVQVIQYLSDYSGLKYTISQYFTPSGYAVHGVGIVPDVVVELDEELLKLSEIPKDRDNQLQEAVKQLKKKLGK